MIRIFRTLSVLIFIIFCLSFMTYSVVFASVQLNKFTTKQVNTVISNALKINAASKFDIEFAEFSDFKVTKPDNILEAEKNSSLVVQTDFEQNLMEDTQILPRLIGRALPYPHPMNLSKGGGEIGYLLSTDMDIELRVYDMAAHEVFRQKFTAGFTGGRAAYNRIPINDAVVGYSLPTGVYIYVLIYQGKVICKEKLAIIR